MITRRGLIGSIGSGIVLSGCDRIGASPAFQSALVSAEGLTMAAQRAVSDRGALAREFRPDQMSPVFRANGNTMPNAPEYRRHLAENFANWRLPVTGLVERPLALSLSALGGMARRTQITRHDCVEGWSAIGQWAGPQLRLLLDAARTKPDARYIVFHCADDFGGRPYYESIDMIDARHPQTILALAMNGRPLPVAHGAPIRLRVERQLGYKHAKYVMGIEAVASLAGIHGGKGGFWEDGSGYEWYGGI